MTADVRSVPADSVLLGITTNVTIKGSPPAPPSGGPSWGWAGIIRQIMCQATNTGTAYLLDGTSTTPSAANTVWALGSAALQPGQVVVLNWPLKSGLTFIPAGGTFNLTWD